MQTKIYLLPITKLPMSQLLLQPATSSHSHHTMDLPTNSSLCNKNSTVLSMCIGGAQADTDREETQEIKHLDVIRTMYGQTNHEPHIPPVGNLLGIVGGLVILIVFLSFLAFLRQRKSYEVCAVSNIL